MSEVVPESPANKRCNEIIDEDIGVDLLIAEVRKRPQLYVKRKAIEVRSRWRHLKDAILKKHAEESQLTSSGKKRKCCFESIQPFVMPTVPTADMDIKQDNNNELDFDFGMASTSSKEVPNLPEAVPDIPAFPTAVVEAKAEEVDENTHFALMLAPMMRKFNDEQRYFARTQILDIMRNVSKMGQPSNIQICNINQLKYTEGQEMPVLRGEDQNIEPEEGTSATAQQTLQYPDTRIQEKSVCTVVRNESGEIQYPETDPEDFDV